MFAGVLSGTGVFSYDSPGMVWLLGDLRLPKAKHNQWRRMAYSVTGFLERWLITIMVREVLWACPFGC
jgi:hypothetical protein